MEKKVKKEQVVSRKSTKKRRKNRPKENSRNNVYDDYPIYAQEIMKNVVQIKLKKKRKKNTFLTNKLCGKNLHIITS